MSKYLGNSYSTVEPNSCFIVHCGADGCQVVTCGIVNPCLLDGCLLDWF